LCFVLFYFSLLAFFLFIFIFALLSNHKIKEKKRVYVIVL
jgi:hypothetical protein